MAEERFDFTDFVRAVRAAPENEWRTRVTQEMGRIRPLVIREAARRFQQQLYLGRLERLLRHLDGEDVSRELTPSEQQAYTLLTVPEIRRLEPERPPLPPPARQAAASAAVVAPATPAPQAEQEGKERRQSRRIQMKTRVRIRRENIKEPDLIEPQNVSRGGIGFVSTKRYALHEIIWVTMHYSAGSEEMETRSLIVRAAPISGLDYSYGVKFLSS